jgi:uncharacterized membrane protein YedE/YeeE
MNTKLIEILMAPWPWYISGFLIGLLMLGLVFLGKTFAFSSNFRTICAACGAGKFIPFFDFDWKSQIWNLIFLLGAILGGHWGMHLQPEAFTPTLSASLSNDLQAMGLEAPQGMHPKELLGAEIWNSPGKILVLILAGFFIGFGTRYAGGCTSGHAITGLSNLQLPSLIAVMGFFIGGLVMTHFILPFILPLL